MRRGWPWALVWAILFGGSSGEAAGLRDFEDSWPVAPNQSARLLLGAVVGEISGSSIWAQAGQGLLFQMPELPQKYLGLGGQHGLGSWTLGWFGSWENTGQQIFRENRIRGGLHWGNVRCWGVSAQWSRQELAGVSGVGKYQICLIGRWSFQGQGFWGRVRWCWPLARDALTTRNPPPMTVLEGTAGARHWVTAVVMDRDGDGTPHLGFHLLWKLAPGFGMGWRSDPASGSLGPGLDLILGRWMLRTSHVAHPQLGVTHRFTLVVDPRGAEGL